MGRESSIVRFHQTGDESVLVYETCELPELGPQDVQIRHEAIGVNFIDTYYRSGLYPTALPSSLGTEGAGVIESIGSEVSRFRVGDRVGYVRGPLGSYAKSRVIHQDFLISIPASISFETAAASMLKGLTVQYLFRQIHPLQRGETFLYHAAAGGVGSIACQWSCHLGARMIGTVGSEEKAKRALSLGASEVINYNQENIVERVKAITQNEKVSVVFDSVGKSTWEASLDCLKPRGLMVSFGNASGPVTGVNLGVLAQKGSLTVTRPMLQDFVRTPEALKQAADEFFGLVSSGAIKIDIHKKFALQDAASAHREIAGRHSMGSVILIP